MAAPVGKVLLSTFLRIFVDQLCSTHAIFRHGVRRAETFQYSFLDSMNCLIFSAVVSCCGARISWRMLCFKVRAVSQLLSHVPVNQI